MVLAVLGGVGLPAACARQSAPSGGPEDRRPPVVVSTTPSVGAVLEDFRGSVRFVFDERISERVTGGTLDDAVIVSPRTGEVHVSRGGNSIEVELEGGFRPGLAYRVQLLPVISDLFNNQLRDPFELVFSTGGTLYPNAVAGVAWDRITQEGVEDARIVLRPLQGDTTIVHVARSDSGGIYAVRYLPPGRYEATAFVDRNRDRILDSGEARGSVNFLVAEADTLLADIPVLAVDTTAAEVRRADALDSLTVLVVLDDFLDPGAPVASVGVILEAGDSASADLDVPGVREVLQVWVYENRVDAVADSFARLDSLAESGAEQLPPMLPSGDTLQPAPDTIPGELPAAPTVGRRTLPPRVPDAATEEERATAPVGADEAFGFVAREGPPPDRRLVVLLDGPLTRGEPYRVVVANVRNINRVPGGGGPAEVRLPLPPPPDSTAVDSLAVDTLAVDSLALDTLAVDTLALDSLVTDTLSVDTLAADTLIGGAVPPASAVAATSRPRREWTAVRSTRGRDAPEPPPGRSVPAAEGVEPVAGAKPGSPQEVR